MISLGIPIRRHPGFDRDLQRLQVTRRFQCSDDRLFSNSARDQTLTCTV